MKAFGVATDDAGDFALLNPPVGPDQLLFIDGGPAPTPERNYPIIPYGKGTGCAPGKVGAFQWVSCVGAAA